MTRNELNNLINKGVIKYHHTSYFRGYISRKTENLPEPKEYKGKFGKGFITLQPCFSSTTYSFISYYIFTKD